MTGRSPLVELCDAIWSMERELDLFSRRIGDVHFWPLLRYRTAGLLSQKMGFHGAQQPRAPVTAAGKIRRILRGLSTGPGTLAPLPHGFDTILLPHDRKLGPREIASDPFSEMVARDEKIGRLLILDDSAPAGGAGRQFVLRRSGLDGMAHVGGRIAAWRDLARAREMCAELSARLQHALGLDFPFSPSALAGHVGTFAARRRLFGLVLAKSGARRLFLVTAYLDQAMVAAAADHGLESVELQHGVISPYHLGYNFPGRPAVAYAPDRLALFGSSWTQGVDLPRDTHTCVIGSPNLERLRGPRKLRNPRSVLVSSQGTIGPALFALTLRAARAAPDWTFVFKPHPGERREDYEARLMSPSPANLSLSAPGDDFYNLILSAEVHVGVYSTTLFEGMALGARTIVVDLPGAEHLAPAIRRGDAVLAGNAQELVRALDSAPKARHADDYYASPVRSVVAVLDGDEGGES